MKLLLYTLIYTIYKLLFTHNEVTMLTNKYWCSKNYTDVQYDLFISYIQTYIAERKTTKICIQSQGQKQQEIKLTNLYGDELVVHFSGKTDTSIITDVDLGTNFGQPWPQYIFVITLFPAKNIRVCSCTCKRWLRTKFGQPRLQLVFVAVLFSRTLEYIMI